MTARSILSAALCLLFLIRVADPAPALANSQFHPDDKLAQDAEGPYLGAGFLQSQGGAPPVEFSSQNVALGSWLTIAELSGSATAGNDCWGYTAPSGREYALIGISNGTAVVEVTDPSNAQLVAHVTGPTSIWRDVKTYGHFAYAVSEGGGGIQVIDLSSVDSGTVTLVTSVTTGGTVDSHNVAINEASGRLYRVGGATLGLRSYDLSDPNLPVFQGTWSDRYCHDAQIVTWTEAPYAGAEIAFCFANTFPSSGSPGLEILDVSDMASVSVIGSIDLTQPPIFEHAAFYSHQGWLSPDRQYVYLNDEVDEGVLGTPTLTRVIDVSDLANPTQVATFTNGGTARDHNLYTQDDLIFEANYRSGLRVFDATDPLAPGEVGYFDTYPPDDGANYNGLWSVYPYFPSGTIIGSDIEKGLFVWTLVDDADGDGVLDSSDICPSAFDPLQIESPTAGTSGDIGVACLCGDVNASGTVNIIDAQVVAMVSVGSLPPSSAPSEFADVNRDGLLNVVDAQLIAIAAVGIIPECNLHCTLAPGPGDADFVNARAACQ